MLFLKVKKKISVGEQSSFAIEVKMLAINFPGEEAVSGWGQKWGEGGMKLLINERRSMAHVMTQYD